MKTLVLNGAGASGSDTNLVALVESDQVVVQKMLSGRGASEQFAPVVLKLLEEAQWAQPLDRIVAVIGPGSFTGLRASLSLAAGLSVGWECPTFGVTLGAAIRATLEQENVTCISIARRGRYFVDAPHGEVFAVQKENLDLEQYELIAGDAFSSEEMAAHSERWVNCTSPSALGIIKAAILQEPSVLAPLYVDPPEAKLPAAGLRPSPL
ncbi:tRNA (adenosine(37)-N6)-threonylcarbamoyltransferase complex dimerization subunit type 1 TsaB [Swingsia samuiensis]|uniref:tRNA (adenosine(37)-N6)-threonylcarbamoyltransferase complex dimerization subunit type 1 TsaB n=1 Tax=Swingsia samuiensis TaxID=1293412 RepID=UPI001FE42F1F|nr:tRNA (adenosine(37)-N6)-threonylcarbamoyltransferase complex dimerization subunit type 1 TsaB [Swingsia samuiensis]